MPDYTINIRARESGGWRVTARVTGRQVPVYRNECVADLSAAAGVVADSVMPAILDADRRGEGK